MDACYAEPRLRPSPLDGMLARLGDAAEISAAFREIYDAIPLALCLFDRTLTVIGANARMGGLLASAAADLTGLSLQALVPELAGRLGPLLRRALAGERLTDVEVRGPLPRRAGAGPTYLVSLAPIRQRDANPAAALCSLTDITARKQSEAALRESKEHYRHAFELSPNVPWTADPDGRILDIAPRCQVLAGVAREDLLGDGWVRQVHPDDAGRVVEAWRQACRSGEPIDEVYRHRTADGRYRWMRSQAAPRRDAEGRVLRWYGVLADVHEWKLVEAALQESERNARDQAALTRSVYAAAPVGLGFVDRQMRCRAMNDRLAAMTHYPAAETIGRHVRDIFRDAQLMHRFERMVGQVLETGVPVEGIEFAVTQSGDPAAGRHFVVSCHPVRGGGESLLGVSIAVVDVTERKRAEARIFHLAQHDALTGLPNRTLLRERLGQALARLSPGQSLALHFIDLDNFKGVNDTWGHPVGDRLLVEAAERLRRCVRESDIVARLGGDEFAVIQAGPKKRGKAGRLAERLIQSLSRPFQVGPHTLVVGCSIGIATAPDDASNADELAKRAELALYSAKRAGRGVCRHFEAALAGPAEFREPLKAAMRAGLIRREFTLHYQPLVALRGGETTSFEALLRWRHPVHGLLAPDVFIPVAEQSGLIVPLGKQVLRAACAAAAGWPGPARVAVNLSAIQFRSPGLVRTVVNALGQSGLPPERLELEITESVLLEDDEANLSILRTLRALGIRIVLDDFGTGFSALGYLRRFPFDKIKIDRSFVRDLTEPEQSGAIVRAIIGLGRSLGITVVAEGVENARQLRRLREEGCDEAQGFLLSPPVAAGEVAATMARLRTFDPLSLRDEGKKPGSEPSAGPPGAASGRLRRRLMDPEGAPSAGFRLVERGVGIPQQGVRLARVPAEGDADADADRNRMPLDHVGRS